jgi:CHC2 zinc finger
LSFDIFTALSEIGKPIERYEYPHQIMCPFHDDARPGGSPSARVYPDTDSIYCWVCDKSWNPISVVAESRGITYRQAKMQLRADFGSFGGSKQHISALDDQLSEIIYASKTIKKGDVEVGDILYAAAAGEPYWEVEQSIRDWIIKYLPRLS